jgi:hypothetical protein
MVLLSKSVTSPARRGAESSQIPLPQESKVPLSKTLLSSVQESKIAVLPCAEEKGQSPRFRCRSFVAKFDERAVGRAEATRGVRKQSAFLKWKLWNACKKYRKRPCTLSRCQRRHRGAQLAVPMAFLQRRGG